MSLNRTLDRLFTEVRREAKRNPAFADRLEAIIKGHAGARAPDAPEAAAGAEQLAPEPQAPAINPVSFLLKEGEEALRAALAAPGFDRAALQTLVAEHNLDPAGTAAGADEAGLIAQIVAQAKKRVSRDKKLFDY